MPFYRCLIPEGSLSYDQRERIAVAFTDVHCGISAAPRRFVQVAFFETTCTGEVADTLPKTATHNVLKQNPYVAYKIFQTLHAFTVDELVDAIEKTLIVDTELKTSGTDDACILEQLVCELCASATGRSPTPF